MPSYIYPPPLEAERTMLEVFGIEDTRMLDLFHRLKAVAHLLDHLIGEYRKDGTLSHARMRLLIRLVVDSRLGVKSGLSPSELSRFLGVSRNTISALLNGLEEQGLIERQLHPTDRRQFIIQITPAGHALVRERAPAFADFVTSLFDSLSPDETQTLSTLLDKLYNNLARQAAALDIRLSGQVPQTDTGHTPSARG